MSLAGSPSLSSMASMASTSSSAAASTVAAVTPLASWASSVATNKHWVGSAWILSSAILTTYSTTKFLKYQGKEEPSSTEQGGSKTLRQFGSILNSTQKQHEEKPQKSLRKTKLSRATLLTLYRFSGSLLLGLFLHSHFYQISRLLPRFLKTVQVAQKFLLPSIFLFIANYSNSIALDRIGISLTYTSKCGIPLITVLFTLLLDGIAALPSNATLFSLLPIAIGIGAASWNSPTFEMFGFLAALTSTMSQAALNVVSKRVMRRTGVKGVEAQRAMVFVALGIGLIMTAANGVAGKLRELQEYGSNIGNVATMEEEAQVTQPVVSSPPLWLTCIAVLAYHMEYVLSFSFVGLVEPITYGTCDALRRLLIIVMGRQLFGGDKFSKTNMGGIFMALLGALMYSITSAKGGGGPKLG
eukprot:CAMPEP_0172316272 /NCGR_PEP_ID=MMETSP1058-20130122/27655_1 /TAXON_ID=83371 /ORGANISM="Detonula confervacea, Strain CCMP 353" /LENGTH=412 /DNA_ID=CAMNT_0013030543 /DNA_START=117 /DNA_END=1355 /DNA_ORIENTATION=+